MKRSIILITAAFLFTGLSSCKDWLDVTPKTEMKGEVLFSNQAGFRDALIGVYALMTDAKAYGTELTMASNDIMAQYYDNVQSTVGHSYIQTANYNYTDAVVAARLSGIWTQQYKAIANLNLILKFIDEKKAVFTGRHYELVKGEALALRALLHFDLLRLFAPSAATGGDRAAIPYVNAYTNVPFPQSSVNQVIDKAMADLIAAKSLLKMSDPYGPESAMVGADDEYGIFGTRSYRMNYFAVSGLMARIALYKGDKPAALTFAKEVIESDLFPMFNGVASNKADYIFPTEQLFCLRVEGLKTKYADKFFPDVYDSRSPDQLVLDNATLADIYPAGVNTDYRLQWFEDASSSSKKVTKYSYNNIIPVIKKSEMYLIAAECEGNVQTAVETYLNVLRAHRGLEPLDGSSMSQEDLKAEIGREYRREFVAEGQLFYYFKRVNATKLPNTVQFEQPEKVYVIPLPEAEIEFGNIN